MVSCPPAPSVGLSGDDDNDLPVERTYALGPRVPALEGLDRPEQVALEPRPDEHEVLRIRLPASPLGLSREGLKLAADYGAPQARKRAVLIGHHRDLTAPGFPTPTHNKHGTDGLQPYRTVRQALTGVPAQPDMDTCFETLRTPVAGRDTPGAFTPRQLHLSRNYSKLSQDRFKAIPEGGNRTNLPDHLKAPCWLRHTTGSMDVMGRLVWDRPSVTIRTEFFKPEKGRYLHPMEHRAITHYEAALLQGFPDTHLFIGSRTAIARQIGNAVPIPLGAAIARQILKEL